MDGHPPSGVLSRATADDAAGIAALLTQPLPGPLRLALAAPGGALRSHAVVVRGGDGRILGHGARSVRRCWLGGRPTLIGYLHGLRRDPALAGAGRALARGIADLAATRAADEADHDLTAILAGNARARRVLERLPGAPAYHALGGYRTAVLAARRFAGAAGLTDWEPTAVQALIDGAARDYAVVADVAATADEWVVLGAPAAPTAAARVVVPDPAPARVVGYAPWLAALRPLANAALAVRGHPTLPAAGTALRLAFIAHLACPPDRRALLALLAAAARSARARGADRLVLGLGDGDPLRPLVDALPAWRLDSLLYAVGARPVGVRPSPEAAWL